MLKASYDLGSNASELAVSKAFYVSELRLDRGLYGAHIGVI